MLSHRWLVLVSICFLFTLSGCESPGTERTVVSVDGASFRINGQPTYPDRTWRGHDIEGLLFNARLVQGIFDDLNPETRRFWTYPDSALWNPDRNTDEFVAAMADWKSYGMLAFTLNMQGGSPTGYGNRDWLNPGYAPDGSLRDDYMGRLERILTRADELGMVVILGLFYFGQDHTLADEAAVIKAVTQVTSWLLDRGYRNVLVEINNECDINYEHPILQCDRVHELISLVASLEEDGLRLLVGTSYSGGIVPGNNVVSVSDFVLIHGNSVGDPARISEMARETRALSSFRPMPILFNEDDHYDFDQPENNMVSAIEAGASWGFFDYRRPGEPFEDGFQSVPVDWTISSARKRTFFTFLKAITGS